MTTVPTDERDARAGRAIDDRPPAEPQAPEAPGPEPARHGRRPRILPGISFPITLFVAWRLVQLVAVVQQGGHAVETAYNYDGEHYLRILHYGYWNPRPVMPSHAFFPGISWLATPIYWITGSDALAVHVTVTVTGVAAFVTVWGVTRAWKDERTARLAVVLLALFPPSLFLWTFYSEGLFIALGAGAVWADRRGRRWVAAACLLGLGTTRSIGILVVGVIVLARVIRERRVDRWAVAYGVAGAAGLGLVLLAMWHQLDNPLAWMGVQEDWGREVSWPWNSVIQGFDNLYPDSQTVMVPALVARNLDLWCVPIVAFAIGYAAISRRDRFPMDTWMLGVAMVALPLASNVLASFNRFAMANWIIYPVYASLARRFPRWLRVGLVVVLGSLALWVNWRLIGRLTVNRFIG